MTQTPLTFTLFGYFYWLSVRLPGAVMIYHLFLCVFGAGMQELFHWLQLKAKLFPEDFSKESKSLWTWVLTIFVIAVLVPSMAFIWFDGTAGAATSKNYFLFGAGVPLILKSGLGASLASDTIVKLGPAAGLRRYLGLRR